MLSSSAKRPDLGGRLGSADNEATFRTMIEKLGSPGPLALAG